MRRHFRQKLRFVLLSLYLQLAVTCAGIRRNFFHGMTFFAITLADTLTIINYWNLL